MGTSLTRNLVSLIVIFSSVLFLGCNKSKFSDQSSNKTGAGVDGFGIGGGSCTIETGVSLKTFLTCPDGTSIEIPEATSCTVTENDMGALIECPDGTSVLVKNGVDGSSGTSCSVAETTEGALISCEDGTHALIKNGVDGKDGTSCTVIDGEGGALIKCDDGSMQLIEDGDDGSDGGVISPWDIKEIIDPCGPEDPDGLDEVILRFQNDQLFAHYSHGNKQHFVFLVPGDYQTTDRTKCNFTVNDDLTISY